MKKWIFFFTCVAHLGLVTEVRADQDATFSNWRIHSDLHLTIAATSNSAGESFGVACANANRACSIFFAFQGLCEKGTTVPFLVSSVYGASAIIGQCQSSEVIRGAALSQVYGPLASATGKDFLGKGADFDVAAPNMAGSFSTAHFSGDGMAAALNKVAELIQALPK